MLREELTKFQKAINIFLNIFIIIFAITSGLLLIGFLFLKNMALYQNSYFLLFTMSLAILLLILAISIVQENKKRNLTLNVDENTIVEINSKEKIENIKKDTNIKYSGNYIITENKKVEINNKTAFKHLHWEIINNLRILSKNKKFLERNPENLFENIMSFLRYGMSFWFIN